MRGKLILIVTGLALLFIQCAPHRACGEEVRGSLRKKVLSVKMLQFGREAYQRGRYLDAKEYFRKAVQADPSSLVAWRYYDQAVIFALAEKVEKGADLIMPDVSTRGALPSKSPAGPSLSLAKPATVKKETELVNIEEGCDW